VQHGGKRTGKGWGREKSLKRKRTRTWTEPEGASTNRGWTGALGVEKKPTRGTLESSGLKDGK